MTKEDNSKEQRSLEKQLSKDTSVGSKKEAWDASIMESMDSREQGIEQTC